MVNSEELDTDENDPTTVLKEAVEYIGASRKTRDRNILGSTGGYQHRVEQRREHEWKDTSGTVEDESRTT